MVGQKVLLLQDPPSSCHGMKASGLPTALGVTQEVSLLIWSPLACPVLSPMPWPHHAPPHLPDICSRTWNTLLRCAKTIIFQDWSQVPLPQGPCKVKCLSLVSPVLPPAELVSPMLPSILWILVGLFSPWVLPLFHMYLYVVGFSGTSLLFPQLPLVYHICS